MMMMMMMMQSPEDPARFRVEILFSPGVVKHPILPGDHLHTAPLVPLHKHLTCKHVVDTLNAAIGEARQAPKRINQVVNSRAPGVVFVFLLVAVRLLRCDCVAAGVSWYNTRVFLLCSLLSHTPASGQ